MSQDDAHRQEKQEHKGMQLVVGENVDLQLDHVNVTSVAFHSDRTCARLLHELTFPSWTVITHHHLGWDRTSHSLSKTASPSES